MEITKLEIVFKMNAVIYAKFWEVIPVVQMIIKVFNLFKAVYTTEGVETRGTSSPNTSRQGRLFNSSKFEDKM